jgi:hypothetical protein
MHCLEKDRDRVQEVHLQACDKALCHQKLGNRLYFQGKELTYPRIDRGSTDSEAVQAILELPSAEELCSITTCLPTTNQLWMSDVSNWDTIHGTYNTVKVSIGLVLEALRDFVLFFMQRREINVKGRGFVDCINNFPSTFEDSETATPNTTAMS